MLESVNCELCGLNNCNLLYSKDTFNINQCNNCKLIYVNPRISKEFREKHYSEEYFKPYFESKEVYVEKRFKRTLRDIERLHKENGKILDVGCGLGFFLELALKNGWEVEGVELSSYAALHAKEKLGLKIFCGELEEAPYNENYFDVVTLLHMIEHSHSPKFLLKKISKILKDNGLLVIETPNIDSPISKMVGESWELLAPKEHLYYFNFNTLKELLKETSFEIINYYTYFWTTPNIVLSSLIGRWVSNKLIIKVIRRILLPLSLIRFLPISNFIIGDVLVVYATKIKK